jgi:hypothetical protein
MNSPDEKKPSLLLDVMALGVFGFVITVAFLLLVFVAAPFRQMFREMDIVLPAMTALTVTLASFARTYWYLALPLMAILGCAPLALGAGRARWFYLLGSILVLALCFLVVIFLFLPMVNTQTLGKN